MDDSGSVRTYEVFVTAREPLVVTVAAASAEGALEEVRRLCGQEPGYADEMRSIALRRVG